MGYRIMWDMDWLLSHMNDFTVIKEFYDAYCIEVDSSISYRSFRRIANDIGFKNPVAEKRVRHEWDDQWIIDNWEKYDKKVRLVYEKYVEHSHDMQLGLKTFQRHCTRNLHLYDSSSFTDEQNQWLIDNYEIYGQNGISDAFEKKFGVYHRHDTLSSRARKGGARVSVEVMLHRQADAKRVPIGTTVVDTRGTTLIKVDEDRWEPLHRFLWKEAHGEEIANDDRIIFLDNDKTNFSLDNLACVDRGTLSALVRFNMLSESGNITRTAIKWYELYSLLKNEHVVGLDTDDEEDEGRNENG